MARYRTIKPDFWTSEQVTECSLNARLLFIGLWNFCDDEGRHPYAPKKIKALIFPCDDVTVDQVEVMMIELDKVGLITRYNIENKDYFYVTGWQHQVINRKQKPRFPAPNSDTDHKPVTDNSVTIHGQNTEHRTQKKEKYKKEKSPRKKSIRLTAESTITENQTLYAREKGFSDEEIATLFEKMRNWSMSSPNGAKLDWEATWRTFVLRQLENKPPKASGPDPPKLKNIVFAELGTPLAQAWTEKQSDPESTREGNGYWIPKAFVDQLELT